MTMAGELKITGVDIWPLRVLLANPYHLSKLYRTLTHSDAVIVRLTLANGVIGWGEADPGGINFDGETTDSVVQTLRERAPQMLGQKVDVWVSSGAGRDYNGAAAAAFDVACYDALGRTTETSVSQLLGQACHSGISSLWPTSSGSAEDDLTIIAEYHAQGFNTYMLKMGVKPVSEDIERLRSVIANVPDGVRVMVDANQGWTREEALRFATETCELPIILIEQPVAAADYEGLRLVRKAAGCPVSVDESIQEAGDMDDILQAEAADIFSIKISKNGGLSNSQIIAKGVSKAGKKVLMNSMIELGITQAASLHLGCTLDNLVDCGHAYMSTLRMADDITDFSSWIDRGVANLPDLPGLGVEVSMEKIRQFQIGHYHVS
ncbi:MAG: L-alanine-DL-glutamate epimerase-like enolase superfamily enzyme [Gammaproteobacteria bacterium]|jgi:L-alanine-DL-glutamate epimerase-like enolase superfamily enzyme